MMLTVKLIGYLFIYLKGERDEKKEELTPPLQHPIKARD